MSDRHPHHITLAILRAAGACTSQRMRFAKLFPNGVTVTRDLCVQHAADFDWAWAATKLLSHEAQAAYGAALAPPQAAYDAALAPAQAAYGAARAPAQATYDAALAEAWASAFLSDAT